MKASTLVTRKPDAHFLARMERATTEERDAVFADLAACAVAGDELAERTIRVLVLPACREIADSAGRGEALVAELVDAAYNEILDWAAQAQEGRATR
ncbi:MAG: hypothetical protein JO086_11785 [Acidimicrobiia bacterium]|nr:hypothetical protein [Acidimicrobiia bacterium]